jgi:hypothetical protein
MTEQSNVHRLEETRERRVEERRQRQIVAAALNRAAGELRTLEALQERKRR